MNRRSFLTRLATAAAGFTILPSAVTYARTWKVAESGLYVGVPIVFDHAVLGSTSRQWFEIQRPLAWYYCNASFSREWFLAAAEKYGPQRDVTQTPTLHLTP
jgi:hypothetical protein